MRRSQRRRVRVLLLGVAFVSLWSGPARAWTVFGLEAEPELEVVLRPGSGVVELRDQASHYLYRYPEQTVNSDGIAYDLLDTTLNAELQALLQSTRGLQSILGALQSGQFLQPRPDLQAMQESAAAQRFERVLSITQNAPAIRAGILNALKATTCSDRLDPVEVGEAMEHSSAQQTRLAGTLAVAAATQSEEQYRLLTHVMFLAACGRDLEPEIPEPTRGR